MVGTGVVALRGARIGIRAADAMVNFYERTVPASGGAVTPNAASAGKTASNAAFRPAVAKTPETVSAVISQIYTENREIIRRRDC